MVGAQAPVSRKARQLAEEAAQAAHLRALSTDPDVVALRVEKVRAQVDRLMWTAIVLGLAFTMVNVQVFAAEGAPAWTLAWVAAWVLDPMVSLALVAVLRAEQVANRWMVRVGPWGRSARWALLAGTYTMNTWTEWAEMVPSRIVLHSVPPLLVFLAAEAVTDLREALGRAIEVAAASPRPAPAAEPERSGTLFVDDLPTIPFPPVPAPAPAAPPVPPVEEEPPAGEEPAGDAGEEPEEEPAEVPPPPEAFEGSKKARARAWWFHERRQGRSRIPAEVNRWIGSDGYVMTRDVEAWEQEYARDQLRVVGE
jgi:hypothetical protein